MSTPISHRCFAPLQKRGNLGKSILVSALGQYLTQRRVDWVGYDLDGDHRSFSRLLPDFVTLRDLTGEEPESEIIKISRNCPANPVTLIDPRAHIAPVILRGWEMIQFVANFAKDGGRVTVPLFVGDDLEVLTDVDGLVSHLVNTVDYVVVRNPARQPRTKMFDGSALEADLHALGAVSLEIPVLLSFARNHLAALEVTLDRGVSPVEAVANPELPLDGMVRLIIEDWLKVLFRRFDLIADKLMPDAYAGKIKPVDAGIPVRTPLNPRGAKLNLTNL
jgi:hypothetical protein